MEVTLFGRRPETIAKKDQQLDPRTPHGRFWKLVEVARLAHPEWSALKAGVWVRNTEEGATLWAQLHADEEFQAHISRGLHIPEQHRQAWLEAGKTPDAAINTEKAARERVVIQKDAGGLTQKQHAAQQLQGLQKRFQASGLNAHDAWTAALADPEGKRYAADYQSPHADYTAAELAQLARDDLRDACKQLAAHRAGQPTDLHSAVLAEQQRGGGDYNAALDRVAADPRNAALVTNWRDAR